jgi:hypothetical protein
MVIVVDKNVIIAGSSFAIITHNTKFFSADSQFGIDKK